MVITTISSRELNQDVARAKRAAKKGPVLITSRGKPEHVLLSMAQYQKLTGHKRSIVEALALQAAAEVEFEAPKANLALRAANLS